MILWYVLHCFYHSSSISVCSTFLSLSLSITSSLSLTLLSILFQSDTLNSLTRFLSITHSLNCSYQVCEIFSRVKTSELIKTFFIIKTNHQLWQQDPLSVEQISVKFERRKSNDKILTLVSKRWLWEFFHYNKVMENILTYGIHLLPNHGVQHFGNYYTFPDFFQT